MHFVDEGHIEVYCLHKHGLMERIEKYSSHDMETHDNDMDITEKNNMI